MARLLGITISLAINMQYTSMLLGALTILSNLYQLRAAPFLEGAVHEIGLHLDRHETDDALLWDTSSFQSPHSLAILQGRDLPTGTCNADTPCVNAACCGTNGLCGYSPTECGQGESSYAPWLSNLRFCGLIQISHQEIAHPIVMPKPSVASTAKQASRTAP